MNYLDRNEFNFEPSDKVKQALENFDAGKLCFYTRIYDEGKKSVFSVRLAEEYGIPESRVILGYGAEQLLKQAVHYFLTLGGSKTMLIPKFSWWYYKSIADEVSGTTLQYDVREEDDTFAYDLPKLKRMVEEIQPKILLVASPNNPTGNALGIEELEDIISSTPKDTIVLVDEAYASFVNKRTDYIARLTETYPNVIICRTLSKFYGLPGLRMGFGFISDSEQMRHFAKYANMYLGYDRLSEDIAIAALDSGEHYDKVALVMQRARDMYNSEIAPLQGFKVYRSLANFILIKYPIALKERLQKAFQNEDYKVKFMNEPGIDTHMRITLGREEQNRLVCDTIKRVAREAGIGQ